MKGRNKLLCVSLNYGINETVKENKNTSFVYSSKCSRVSFAFDYAAANLQLFSEVLVMQSNFVG